MIAYIIISIILHPENYTGTSTLHFIGNQHDPQKVISLLTYKLVVLSCQKVVLGNVKICSIRAPKDRS